MSLDHASFKLLQLNVVSAQDLPAVSKMLRTFAVAWIHPDQKLSTVIDHQGHTNPTWNYKLVFRVDNKFLRADTSAITIEIYNVAWLRDLPIGAAQLFVNHLSPPLMSNSQTMRPVALHIRRPSGHLQGILHLGINLIDNGISDSPQRSEISALPVENQVKVQGNYQNVQEESHSKDEKKIQQEALEFLRQRSIKRNLLPYADDVSSMQGSAEELNVKPSSMASTNVPVVSVRHPLPSEIAVNLKKGFYTAGETEYGSSIFENWSDPSDHIGDGFRSKNVEWRMEDRIPLTKDHDSYRTKYCEGHKTKDQKVYKAKGHEGHKMKDLEGHKSVQPRWRKQSDGGGLFSCFMRGFEFTFVCGSKNIKESRKKIHHHQKFHADHEHIPRFHL